MPDLDFQIENAESVKFAAVPTLLFKLFIRNVSGEPVRSVTLNTQIRIAARQRHYSEAEQERLAEVFGDAQNWGSSLSSMLWTHTTIVVPPFNSDTVVDMLVGCTYDFEVVNTKYFHALEDGEIPLEFLFSGTIFYAGDTGLQVTQISWDKEAQYRMPVQVWERTMEHYFPNSAWVRLSQDTFDRLHQYRSRHGLPTWDDALDRLLPAEEDGR